jgi:hypothetical protein
VTHSARIQLAQDDRVTAILFAHPDSLLYLKAYPNILLLDCTYKINKYRIPLLDIIGVNTCQRFEFAFLSGEQDYYWALEHLILMCRTCKARFLSVNMTNRCLPCINAVAIHFPSAHSLLCLWHANKTVLQQCQPAFILARQATIDKQLLLALHPLANWKLIIGRSSISPSIQL